jgi:1,4-dihydroxy-6-naphthoate synthase
MSIKRVEIAASPCPNDVFILSGLILNKVLTSFEYSFKFADIETLNELALKKAFPVIKVSFALYPEVYPDYQILSCGSALGFGVGPLLVSRKEIKELNFADFKVGIPGRYTTAYFLFKFFYPKEIQKIFLPYYEIIPALLRGDIDLGVLIHEGRFVYAKYGLFLVQDLGTYWEERVNAPLPLGGFLVKRDFPEDKKNRILQDLRRSLKYAWAKKDEVYPLLKKYAQELSQEVIFNHIQTYVNSYTLKLEGEALKGIKVFFETLNFKEDPENFIWENKDGIS